MTVDVWTLQVGDKVREVGSPNVLTVWRIDPPGSLGRAHRHGSSINAHTCPGGYGTSFDNETADRFERV